jgi:large subunit ribosomal protein L4
MELEVYNIKGENTARKVTLKDDIFAIEPNDHAIYLDVKQFLANKRQGTHSSKERSMLSGSTRKLKRQKGTGTARMGDIKSPILRGGARVFGPQPRIYRFKLNKKLKRLANMSALTYKAQENSIKVVEDFDFDSPKTRNYAEMLKNLQVEGKKTILVVSESKDNINLAARNIPGASVIQASNLNTYEILNANNILFIESSLGKIEERFAQA